MYVQGFSTVEAGERGPGRPVQFLLIQGLGFITSALFFFFIDMLNIVIYTSTTVEAVWETRYVDVQQTLKSLPFFIIAPHRMACAARTLYSRPDRPVTDS